jgi:hypothetical protein
MKIRVLRFALPIIALVAASLKAQPAASVDYYQVVNVIRVTPGKNAEFVKYLEENSRKVAQMRADSGEIISWTLLRAVYPAGKEAAGDYMISTVYPGVPPEPKTGAALSAVYQKAGVRMTTAEATERRNSLSSLVTTEMWRIRERLGASAKGQYMQRNLMRIKDSAGYTGFVNSVSKPVADGLVKAGALSAWSMATKVFPAGTDNAYSAYTVDVFPSWAAVFQPLPYQAAVDKFAPGKTYQELMSGGSKFRDLAVRDLWMVEDRVVKSK